MWNSRQQGAWNGERQQAAWNGGQQAVWNGHQEPPPSRNDDQQQRSWDHQQRSSWSEPPQETWSAEEQGSWDAQEQAEFGGGETAAAWDGATESPADAFGYGYGDGTGEPDSRNGHNASYVRNGSAGGEDFPPADAHSASEAARSWWDGEEAQTAELPTVKRAQQNQSAQVAYNQCGNCGVRNHPSLRYCEQCWTVLVP